MSAPTLAHPPAAVPVWRVWLGWLGTVVAVAASLFWSLIDTAFASHGGNATVVLRGMVAMLAGLGIAVLLIWRRSLAVVVCLTSAATSVLLPIGAFATLLSLTWVYASARIRTVIACTAAAGVALGVTLGRDFAREGADVMWAATDATTGERSYLTGTGYVVMGLVVLVVAVAVGLARRFQSDAGRARAAAAREARQAAALRSQADDLRTEVSRQDERELIAREMHDTVAHHLSLVSLHASALEVTADDPATDVPEAARSMRTTAHRALEEMRTLITSLRTAGDTLAEQYEGPAQRLGDLPDLVDRARDAGVDIGASVFVDQADDAPPALTRAVYRVVQESLTNTMKHAPGARVDVDVRARPGRGIDVVVRNALVDAGGAPTPRGGAGIIGMRERALALGGTFAAGAEGRDFVVRVHLPW